LPGPTTGRFFLQQFLSYYDRLATVKYLTGVIEVLSVICAENAVLLSRRALITEILCQPTRKCNVTCSQLASSLFTKAHRSTQGNKPSPRRQQPDS
jgi:hypothetical protein